MDFLKILDQEINKMFEIQAKGTVNLFLLE